MTRRCRFSVFFDAHNADGRCWCVRAGRRPWIVTKRVVIQVPTETVYRGPNARQPRAFLTGYGRVRVFPVTDAVVIL